MKKKLKKKLGLLDIFCIATGTMINSGLFILPGLAFAKAGPAVIVSYIFAALLCIPTLLSKAELTTAMPKAGGDYFYIMRGFGPLLGTMAGISSWFSITLKSAFALVGMGAYLSLMTTMPLEIVSICCCLFFIVLNLFGVKEVVKFQSFFVLSILGILVFYIILGFDKINPQNFKPFFSKGFGSVLVTASFVFISYGGVTKVSALAEETKNPSKNLPLGMILSLIVAAIFYVLVIFVTVGVFDPANLEVSLTPISDGADIFGGSILKIVMIIGALLAFISAANSGIMSASRYPFAMSRDKLLPSIFQKLSSKFKTPYISILVTGLFIMLSLLFLKLELLVKIASSILIVLFIFSNFTLILFRESKILSYKPKFISPFYPYMQIIGIIAGGFFLIEMGSFIVFLTMLFLLIGFIWYRIYAKKRADQDYALIYVLARLVSKDNHLPSEGLLSELKDIVFQRDNPIKDRFYGLVEQSHVLDIKGPITIENFLKKVAGILSKDLTLHEKDVFENMMNRERTVSTIIRPGLAVPHIIVDSKKNSEIILVRAKAGIIFPNDQIVHIAFITVGSADKPNLHLQDLAAIAQIAQDPTLDSHWMQAKNEQELRDIILLSKKK